MNYLRLLCFHLHLFPYFLSHLNPFSLSSNHCLLISGHTNLRLQTPILHIEHSKSINILLKCNLFLETFFSLSRQVSTFVYTTRSQSLHFPYGLETMCLHLAYLPGGEQLQERSDQSAFVFMSQG